MMGLDIAATVRAVQGNGPTRVVIDDEGEAVPARRADAMGITPSVVFVRSDGWTLGAPDGLVERAYRLWESRWVAVVVGLDIGTGTVLTVPAWLGSLMVDKIRGEVAWLEQQVRAMDVDECAAVDPDADTLP